MKAFLEKTTAILFVLCIVFIPLNFDGKGMQFQITKFIFEDLIRFLQNHFFVNALKSIDFSSDTIALNLLIVVLFLLAVLIATALSIFKIATEKLIYLSKIIITYYLAFILLKYGFDKIFKVQFYLPEPNILFTPFGDLSPDILYWSTMGTSRFYCVSLGIIEVLAAGLILIKNTRVLGMLIAIGVFINVILVNFGFDISVKTFSCLLLLMTLFVLTPFFKSLYVFFISRKQAQLKQKEDVVLFNRSLKNVTKTFVIGLLLVQVLYPYVVSGNINDDKAERLFLHGAYTIKQIVIDNDTVKPSDFPIKKVFVHRNSYLIFQKSNDQMVDYFMKNDLLKKQLELYDYHQNKILVHYKYKERDSVLELVFDNGKKWKIVSKAINWKKCNVFRDEFHLTVDEVK